MRIEISEVSKIIFLTISVILLFSFYGCATIMTGTSQVVNLDTPMLTGASCKLTDIKGRNYHLPNTPGHITVEKGDGPMTVVCEKEGYENGILVVEEGIHGAVLGNILIGGGNGLIIDAVSGGGQEYPENIVVWMKPLKFSSAEEEKEWNEAKEKYDESQAAVDEEAQNLAAGGEDVGD